MDPDDHTPAGRRGDPPAAGVEASAAGEAPAARRLPLVGEWPAGSLAFTVAFALGVAVAFADSSIVVLALPELYLEFDPSIPGLSWVITSYNVAVALGAFALLPLARVLRPGPMAVSGLLLFLAASLGCSLADSLTALVAARSVQGIGAALLLAGSLPVLVGLAGSARRALLVWTGAGAFGVALGPALGGILTELFDWRAIFVAQAPIAAAALVAALGAKARAAPVESERPFRRGLLAANLGLLALFGALVGALFLAVLLVVTVWDLGPLAGAGIVSALPLAAVAVQPLASRLLPPMDAVAGALLLAAGLAALALLPASSPVYAALALAVCGSGFGLAVPPLTRASVDPDAGLFRSGTVSIGSRHLGLVLGLVLIAPLLASELERTGERAAINATAVILDARLPLDKKIPIALDLRDEFERVPAGEIPDLARPFEENGAADDPRVATARDDLLDSIEAALTRGFRSSFGLAALLAALAVAPALALGRRRAA